MTGLWTIIPVKDTRFSKQRLADRFDADLRQRLALTMLEDVLAAIASTGDVSRLVLVTVDPTAIALAARYDARTIDDGAHDGHTGAVTAAARRLHGEGATGYITLPGDIPLIAAGEVRAIVAAHACGPAFTIAPSHDEMGSNAIACSPPDAVPLRFGDDSYHPHLAAARAAGITPTVLDLPGIAEDIDTPADIDRFMRLPESPRTRTYAFLNEVTSASIAPAESPA